MRFWDDEYPTQAHAGDKWQSQNVNALLLDSDLCVPEHIKPNKHTSDSIEHFQCEDPGELYLKSGVLLLNTEVQCPDYTGQ